MTKDAKNLIVGLDIGTSKVVAVVAEVMSDGRHEVIGLGTLWRNRPPIFCHRLSAFSSAILVVT